jgi:hypothetical protein
MWKVGVQLYTYNMVSKKSPSSTSSIRQMSEFILQSLVRRRDHPIDTYSQLHFDQMLEIWGICIHEAQSDQDIPIALGDNITREFQLLKDRINCT